MNFRPADFLQDVKTLFAMLWASVKGKYKFPWGPVLLTLVCAVYVISPVDILPDVMPLLGITDDGAFIVLVLALWQKSIKAYRQSLAQPADKDQVIDTQAYKTDSAPGKKDK